MKRKESAANNPVGPDEQKPEDGDPIPGGGCYNFQNLDVEGNAFDYCWIAAENPDDIPSDTELVLHITRNCSALRQATHKSKVYPSELDADTRLCGCCPNAFSEYNSSNSHERTRTLLALDPEDVGLSPTGEV